MTYVWPWVNLFTWNLYHSYLNRTNLLVIFLSLNTENTICLKKKIVALEHHNVKSSMTNLWNFLIFQWNLENLLNSRYFRDNLELDSYFLKLNTGSTDKTNSMNQMKTQHSIATARALNMIYDHSARAHALKLKKTNSVNRWSAEGEKNYFISSLFK